MIDIQEEFCFGEENTEGAIASPDFVLVNITRSSPACGVAIIFLMLSFISNGKNMCKYTQSSGHVLA